MTKKRVTNFNAPVTNNTVNMYVAPRQPVRRTHNKLLICAIFVIVIVMLAPHVVTPTSPLMIWAVLYLLYRGCKPLVADAKARADVERRRRGELAAHADAEHAQIMQGDSRGTYGQYPPDEAI